MLLNIVLYVLFERRARKQWDWKKELYILRIPIILLVLFLMGYIAVGIFGNPDLIIGAILLGGSIFVLLILQFMKILTGRIKQNEDLRVALVAAEQASSAKSAFLSNMSHDIRTPLNAIIGFSNLAGDESATPEEIRSYIEKINASGQHLLELINDVLEMSRIESGKMELNNAPADLHSLMEGVKDIFSAQMEEKGLLFNVQSELNDHAVICDRVRLERVLFNLISNAYKFTPQGGSVDVRLVQTGKEDDLCSYELHVADTGIGMEPEFAKKVFEAFERERTSTVSGIQGTGLGMAITKNIVDLMGGSVDVKTAPGCGTEFIVKLSLKACDESLISARKPCSRECAGAFSGKRILLAEDVMVNQMIARMVLEKMGFEVATADNGLAALNLVRDSEEPYDAVLMDIQMPEMNGYEATEAIRRIEDPVRAAVPVIALTANAFEEDKRMASEAGMNGHISKPLNPEELKSELAHVLKISD